MGEGMLHWKTWARCWEAPRWVHTMGRSTRRTMRVQSLAHHQGRGDTRLITTDQSSVHPAHVTQQTRRTHPIVEILCNHQSRTEKGCTSRHHHCGKDLSSGTWTLPRRDSIHVGAPQRPLTATNHWTSRTGNQQEMTMAGHGCHPQNTVAETNARRLRIVVRTKHPRRSSTEPHARKT